MSALSRLQEKEKLKADQQAKADAAGLTLDEYRASQRQAHSDGIADDVSGVSKKQDSEMSNENLGPADENMDHGGWNCAKLFATLVSVVVVLRPPYLRLPVSLR